MKILCVEPGPIHSTWDVYQGISEALKRRGHGIGTFALHNRIPHADKCLQMRWKDAGSLPEQEPRASDIIFHASSEAVQHALYHEVDLVLFIASGLVHPGVYQMLRRAKVPTAILLTESPYEDERQLPLAEMIDTVWTNERISLDLFRQLNPRSFYYRHAYDPDRHCPGPSSVVGHDVVFVGTLWQERIDLLCEIDWMGIDLGIYGSVDLFDLEKYPYNAEKKAKLEPYLHPAFLSNERTVELYRASKIAINWHRTTVHLGDDLHLQGAESMNPRCYEIPAVGGALLITDFRAEVTETYGTTVPIFNDAEGLQECIRYYLKCPEARAEHVRRLRKMVQPHTYDARVDQMLEEIHGN